MIMLWQRIVLLRLLLYSLCGQQYISQNSRCFVEYAFYVEVFVQFSVSQLGVYFKKRDIKAIFRDGLKASVFRDRGIRVKVCELFPNHFKHAIEENTRNATSRAMIVDNDEVLESTYFRLCFTLKNGVSANCVASVLEQELQTEMHNVRGRLMCYTIFIILRPYISEERRCFVEADREDVVVVYFKRLEPFRLYGEAGPLLCAKYDALLRKRNLVNAVVLMRVFRWRKSRGRCVTRKRKRATNHFARGNSRVSRKSFGSGRLLIIINCGEIRRRRMVDTKFETVAWLDGAVRLWSVVMFSLYRIYFLFDVIMVLGNFRTSTAMILFIFSSM